MADLLVELVGEEIPARMQQGAARDLDRMVSDRLKAAGLTWDALTTYAGPRRLTLVIDGLPAATRAHARAHWRQGGYYRMLGKMLFGAAPPPERWRIFSRFYGLDPALIQRFYAGRSTLADRIRILCGKPPVPIRSAMRTLLNPPG